MAAAPDILGRHVIQRAEIEALAAHVCRRYGKDARRSWQRPFTKQVRRRYSIHVDTNSSAAAVPSSDAWDAQIETDLEAGRLDALLHEVDAEIEAGLASGRIPGSA